MNACNRFILSDTPFDAAICSIIGQREQQEDAACVASTKCAIFDGLGGHRGGARASETAANTFASACHRHFAPSIREINIQVGGLRSGLTTVAAAWLSEKIEFAWAGDSRIYVFRQSYVAQDGWSQMSRRSRRSSQLTQLTADHGGGGGAISRCLGLSSCCGPQFGTAPRLAGDIVVLTTDGFHEVIHPQIFEQTLVRLKNGSAEEIATALIDAMRESANDNATVVVVKT